MNKKIVVLCGSLNPITKAHRMILENAISKVGAEFGLFFLVPDVYLNKKIALKKQEDVLFVLPEDVRKQMVDSLSNEFPNIRYGGVELGGANPATVKTLMKIQKTYPDYELYFSIGADKLRGISHWRDFDKIFNTINLIVYPRVGYDIDKIINNSDELLKMKNRITILDDLAQAKGISSSEIRTRFFNSQDYKDLMDEAPYQIFKQFKPDDFHKISDEDQIEYELLYGGRFKENNARKLVCKLNTKLFNNWDEKLLGNRNLKLDGTKVYKDEFKTDFKFNYQTSFGCYNEDCVDIAERLIKEGYNPAILNLASNVRPCGGYDDGTLAQEESLCYSSTLSQSLYQFGSLRRKVVKDANVNNYPGVYPLDINFGGIYSPDVTFFRNNISKKYTIRDEVFSCPVITVASLSNREKNKYTNNERFYFNNDGSLTSEGRDIEYNKMRTIFRIALENGHDSIVLGAFGCGVYNLIPGEVAKMFSDILEEPEFKNNFKKVVFAIYERPRRNKVIGENGKFKPYYDLFNK